MPVSLSIVHTPWVTRSTLTLKNIKGTKILTTVVFFFKSSLLSEKDTIETIESSQLWGSYQFKAMPCILVEPMVGISNIVGTC